MNELAKRNAALKAEVERYRDAYLACRAKAEPPAFADYPLPALKARITRALSERRGGGELSPQFDLIDREQFGGDIAVKFPQLLRDGGPKGFIDKHLPWITEVLEGPDFADAIAAVETKGMYINLRLTDRWLLEAAWRICELGEDFATNDAEGDETVLVDYSSPNVAKVLHAGHIRSTIIGHVLCNMHEACGADVYRVNHINDFGGFGFSLEGWRRFEDRFPADMGDNERLLEIYRIRRTAEKYAVEDADFDAIPAADKAVLERYFPEADSTGELISAWHNFVRAADARFEKLEAGDAEEVALWAKMVEWSLADFEAFYDALDIHIDLVLGESFYFQAGERVVDACLEAGTAVLFDRARADAEIAKLDARVEAEKMKPEERDKRAAAIEKDIGAVVALLPDGERMVVRRADGRSIYATRDIGAIALRKELFAPSRMTYVVGQEQRVHFERLFKAAEALGLVEPGEIDFTHLWFGFYVDAETGKKLSSRDTVANVNHLLAESVAYFRAKYDERDDQTPEEVDHAAQQLAVGSLVFNDLKQDVKGSVEIATSDLQATIESFEKSGGAYMVYSACRARSILRKWGKAPVPASEVADFEIDAQEAALILKLQTIPEKLAAAAGQANPVVLVRHLLETAGIYNSYYMRAPVISGGEANPSRLIITQAVQVALTNALKICHIECPPKI
ncbi:arginine--tRNA ligase [Marinicauda salina]|uniref:Arginine--tRNA ligase n=1 Tax=Marinicauda salina TaxID=2135793 RepID=A0A2U2BVT5_9PROT|nr:arginine--tRNA ligase [Marinicauda salina]PWE18136.1 arginine--tRNA ligase [Marinicauda salina]